MVKIGAVGTGSRFQIAHAPSYPSLEEAQLVAIADPSESNLKAALRHLRQIYESAAKEADLLDPDRAEQLRATASSIKGYTSLDAMLAREEVELIDFCMPARYHDQIIEAVKRGIAAMMEKPMAYSYLEAQRIWQAVKDNRVFFQYNEEGIFDPFYYTAKKIVDGGSIGEPLLVSVGLSLSGPEEEGWPWDWTQTGGGALVGLASKAITVGYFIAGFKKQIAQIKSAEPDGISRNVGDRLMGHRFRSFDVEDDAHVLLRLEGEKGDWVTLLAEGSWLAEGSNYLAVQGTKGTLKGEKSDTKLHVTEFSGQAREVSVPRWNSFEMELSNALECLKDGNHSISDEDVGLETMVAVGGAYLSELKGRIAVTPDEFKDFAATFKSGEELVRTLIEGIRRK
mgnify:CR=1 FL=1